MTLVATSSDFASSEPLVLSVAADNEREDVVLNLRRGATITGEIHASQGEVAERQITLSGGSWNRTESDEEGRFEFAGLEPGEYEVQLGTNGGGGGGGRVRGRGQNFMAGMVKAKSVKVTVGAGEREHVVVGEPSANAIAVSGLVTNDGKPIAGGLVTVYGKDGGDALATTECESDGTYSLNVDDGPGEYRFMVGKGWGKQSPFDVTLAGSPSRQDFEMPGGSMSGTILASDGGALEGAVLTLSLADDANATGTSRFARRRTESTKADGSYQFDDLAAGTYMLRVGVPRGRTDLARIIIRDVEHDGEESVRKDVQLPLGGEVTGSVVDTAGRAVRNANMRFEDEQGTNLLDWGRSRSNRGGEFSQGGLPPQTIYVVARMGDRRSERVAARVTSGGSTSVQVTLPAE